MDQTVEQLKKKYNASTEKELFAKLADTLLFCFYHNQMWLHDTEEDFIDLIKNY